MPYRGFTLVETIVAVVLLAAVVMLLLASIPPGLLGLKQAENLQTARGLALQLLETAPPPVALPSVPERFERSLNGTRFQIVRSVQKTGPHTYRLTVKVDWPRAGQPLQLRLRRFSSRELP